MDVAESTPAPPNNIPAGYLTLIDSRSQHQSQQLLPLWDREIFKIGRDPKSNSLAIDNDPNFNVSRNHCEVYVVVYEPTVNYIYVRDRKSSNGTFVNGVLIGQGPEISSGYLLQDGDVIEIRPHWGFILSQERSPPRQELNKLQADECKLFDDRYLLTNRCLGQGAEATVHLAIDVATKKQLVCKLVNLDRIHGRNTREEVRRKYQEGDILRQLRHPNILSYVDMISSPHTLYTFTELASGGDLMSFIYRQDRVTEFDSRIIIRQVVRGLQYLHGKHIVHRDLKPENILLAYSPKIAYHRVMLADFGNSAVPKRSRMVTIVGTLNYQAPEILASTQAQTSAVDIWSLGVVAFLLLSSASDTQIEDLNRMNQVDIGEYIKNTFTKLIRPTSSYGKRFIFDCLQIEPSSRPSAVDTEWHDWLCNPRKYRQFFEYLETKMYSEWKPQDELKPLPLELPDLRATVSAPNASQEPDVRCSQYFATNAILQQPLSVAIGNDSENNEATGGDQGTAKQGAFIPPFQVRGSDPAVKLQAADASHLENQSKRDKLNFQNFIKPNYLAKTGSRAARKKNSRVKVPETDLLPLPGLDRHLLPMSSNRVRRQKVLKELEKSKMKFLVKPDETS
ncbi:kinase-like domain-containing protein [Mariannaea sp. PMI_226]|nr:kinase-like domain-containing protein [Mariannaea sp. PMI_226]